MTVSALDEERKLLKHIPSQKCPVAFEVTRQNMLRSTVLNREIKYNMESVHEILPTMLGLLHKFDPEVSKAVWKTLKIEWEAKIFAHQPANTTDDISDIDNAIMDQLRESNNA